MKTLHLTTSKKELAAMYNVSLISIYRYLSKFKLKKYARLNRAQVIEIFEKLGYPEGYEHYEKQK